MGKQDSLTQIFTTKNVPKDYAQLFNEVFEICQNLEDGLTKADLLAEAIYDLALKRLGEKVTARNLKWLREGLGIEEPKVSIQAKLELGK